MLKIAIGFIIFAALAMWVLSKGGDVDISGEKHGIETSADHGPAAASAAAPAAMPSAPASAASN